MSFAPGASASQTEAQDARLFSDQDADALTMGFRVCARAARQGPFFASSGEQLWRTVFPLCLVAATVL